MKAPNPYHAPFFALFAPKAFSRPTPSPQRRLRILHLESSRNIGGQELRILAQMEWLISHGHSAWLLAHPDTPILREAAKKGLPCYPTPFRGSLHPKAIISVLGIAKRHSVDIIDCHSSRDAAVGMVAKLLGKKVVRSQHIGRKIKDDLFHKFMWRVGSHGIIATSESIKRQILRQGLAPSRLVYVVPPGIRMDVFNPNVDGSQVRKKYGVSETAKLVTLIGMIRRDKGQRFLVRAIDSIVRVIPNAFFMIIGSATHPEYLDNLKEEISRIINKDRVILTGFQDRIEYFIAASNVIAITSLMEARSLAAMQAF